VRCDVHVGWVGQELERVEERTGARVAYLTRLGRGMVPAPRTVVQENDVVHLMVATDRIGSAQRVLAGPPGREES
jgi:trk system potassium uptake protein